MFILFFIDSFVDLKLLPLVQLVRMDYTEVIIDQRFHRHLIGKNGSNSECTQLLVHVFNNRTSLFLWSNQAKMTSHEFNECVFLLLLIS